MNTDDLTIALEAAKRAAKIVAKGFNNVKEITEKPVGHFTTFVTETDKASEAAIISFLQENSPYSILAEESGKSGISKVTGSSIPWMEQPISVEESHSLL